MNFDRWRELGAALILGATWMTVAGCELIVRPDRSLITKGSGGGGGQGGSGGDGAAAGMGGAGGSGGGCTSVVDCPVPPEECLVATCEDSVCGVASAPVGTVLEDPVDGDCKALQCADGDAVEVDDDSDLHVDNNVCTADVCTGGVPANPPLPAGDACGTGLVCDGMGQCVGCVVADDCPGQDTECQTRTCDANSVCGLSFMEAGTVVPSQTDGDCQEDQCDGTGAVVSVDDDDDLPVDGLQCTTDVCTAGSPTNPPLPSGEACSQGGGSLCNGLGACVECLSASTCSGQDTECQARTCVAGACGLSFEPPGTPVAMQTAGDCQVSQCDGAGVTVSAADDTDVPVDNLQCTDDVCTAGSPSNPSTTSGAACNQNGGAVCNGAGACVECVAADGCPGQDTECQTRTCLANACGFSYQLAGTPVAMQTEGDCQVSQCDGAGAVVSVAADTDLPVDGNQCTDDICTAGTPSHPNTASGVACDENGGQLCNGNGACVECLTAATCPGQDTECQTRTCMASACGIDFTMAGTDVAAQIAGDCHVDECDGAGGVSTSVDDTDVPIDTNQCTANVCTAGAPSHPLLPAGTACTQNGGSVCNAAGVCVPALVSSVNYQVIAHGGRLILTGYGFTGATAVTVGVTSQTFVVGSDTQITINSLADATPVAAQNVVVTKPGGSSAPHGVTVIRLLINELDSHTPGTDLLEFVEISTGVPGVNLSGYTLVFYNGAIDQSYLALGLNAAANANGLLLVGNPGVVPTPALTFPSNMVQPGPDAVAVYQALPAAFPNTTPVTATGLIDALVYSTDSIVDAGLLNVLITSTAVSPARVQVNENQNGTSTTDSIQRCGNARRNGSKYRVGAPPTPSALNNVTACP